MKQIKRMIFLIQKDYNQRYSRKINRKDFIKNYILDLGFRVVVRYRVQSIFWHRRRFLKLISIMIKNGSVKKYGFEIANSAIIEEGFSVQHINGVVIGEGVKIGKNFTVYQQTTIGQKDNKYPVLGDGITLYPGSKVLGGIHVDNNCILGPNSILLKSTQPNSVLAGIPAKVIGVKGNMLNAK